MAFPPLTLTRETNPNGKQNTRGEGRFQKRNRENGSRRGSEVGYRNEVRCQAHGVRAETAT
eukprot:5944419-Prorocentrum_lima.AAC.1